MPPKPKIEWLVAEEEPTAVAPLVVEAETPKEEAVHADHVETAVDTALEAKTDPEPVAYTAPVTTLEEVKAAPEPIVSEETKAAPEETITVVHEAVVTAIEEVIKYFCIVFEFRECHTSFVTLLCHRYALA